MLYWTFGDFWFNLWIIPEQTIQWVAWDIVMHSSKCMNYILPPVQVGREYVWFIVDFLEAVYFDLGQIWFLMEAFFWLVLHSICEKILLHKIKQYCWCLANYKMGILKNFEFDRFFYLQYSCFNCIYIALVNKKTLKNF